MSFPWMTEEQRRKRAQDEEFAQRAVADLTLKLSGDPLYIKVRITRIKCDGMAGILRVLRPARRPASLVVGKTGTGRSTLSEKLIRSMMEN
jgi:hypothetical protein